MGRKIKCLKCGDIIESKHIHDFKFCKCENIFIDGGNDYTRYGGLGLEDNSFEFVNDDFYGVIGTTKIGIIRNSVEDQMYVDIETMYNSGNYNIFGVDKNLHFIDLDTISIERSENRLQTYVFIFSNDCSVGKRSFGTEEKIIATLNCPVLKLDGTETKLEYLKYGEEILSIKRYIYSEEISRCKSKLIYSFQYYDEYVYNIKFEGGYKYFCSNGSFIRSL